MTEELISDRQRLGQRPERVDKGGNLTEELRSDRQRLGQMREGIDKGGNLTGELRSDREGKTISHEPVPKDTGPDFKFRSVEPEPIPGAEDIPKMDFVPLGMEKPVVREPTRADLEPLRKVAVSPIEYLKGEEERSLFLSRIRYRMRKLPYTNTNIFILQIAAIISLYIAIAANFYINPPESGILSELPGFTDYLVWNTALGASLLVIFCGTGIGGLGAYIKGLSMKKKTQLSTYFMQIIAVTIIVITVFFIIVPSFHITQLDFNNLELFLDYVIVPSVYLIFLMIFSSAVILGVYGLLTGNSGAIGLSTALIFLQITFAINDISIETKGDLVKMFMEESRITIFSMAYLAYVELSFAVSKFTWDWKRTSRYDHRTGTTTFTDHLGHTINVYIILFIGIIIATYLMAMFTAHLDTLFSYLLSPAMKDSIEHSTIYGKVLFVLFFFGLIGIIKRIIPAQEYITGKMNVVQEGIENPMTIVEGSGQGEIY